MNRGRIVKIIKKTLQENGIKKAYLFGSFARKDKTYHDIDIAIKSPKGFSLLDLARLENALEAKTKKKIDLGTIESIHPLVKEHIKRDLAALL